MLFPTTNTAASGGLSEEIWQFFRQQGELKDLSPQAGLFRQDEPIDRIFLLEGGLVKLTCTNAKGREVVVGLRFPGTMLGAASAVYDQPAPASAATLEASRLHCLPAIAFLQQMETSPAFARQVTRAVCQNYHEQTLHLAWLGALSARGRVASLLLQFTPAAEPDRNGEIRLQLPVNQTDAAGLLAMSRETYNRMLRELKREELIRQSKGWIYICNLELLRREAGE